MLCALLNRYNFSNSMNAETPKILDSTNAELSPDEMIGQVFGVYQITKQIGRGGMSLVYAAERIDGAFKQQAAIKFLKKGMDTDAILRRFRKERQILAALSHPNIALLYDGGTTPQGSPYFVMEYVAGKPIYRFCDEQKLNVKERLKIFVQICEAVHAAHLIKIVHRDIKPSNILVKPGGAPKLLDFGIAKLLDPVLANETYLPTETHLRLMTPEYASPEQITGGEITIASDIYSLGVLLYELLSGHRPYRLKNRSPYEIARVVCEQTPESLSDSLENEQTVLDKSAAQPLAKILESRSTNLSELSAELTSDLQQIVTNAMQKNPAERYQSTLELAADIGLYLSGNPVRKRAVAKRNLKSSASREKPSLAVLPLKIVGTRTNDESYLAIGLADALITRLSNVRRIVVRPTSAVLLFAETENAVAAGRRLEADFVLSGTIRRHANRLRISTQLVRVESEAILWADKFDEDLTDVLDLEDALAEKVGNLLIPQLTGDEQEKLSKRGTNDAQAFDAYLRARYNLYLFTPESYAKAKLYFEQAVRLDPNYALAYIGLAEFYFALTAFGATPPLAAYSKSRESALRALEIDDSMGEAYAVLAACDHEDFDFIRMEKNLRRSIELNPNYPLSRIWLSNVLTFFGKSEEAIAEARRAVELNPISTFEKRQLAWIYSHNNRLDKALEVSRAAVEAEPDSGYCLTFYSRILRICGKLDESVETAARSVKIDPQISLFVTNYAASLAAVGETEKARQVLQTMENLPPEIYVSPFNMAIAYVNLGEEESALEQLEYGYQTRDQRITWIATDPQLDALRGNPRFQNLLDRLQNPTVR